jgi:hypothetical protein
MTPRVQTAIDANGKHTGNRYLTQVAMQSLICYLVWTERRCDFQYDNSEHETCLICITRCFITLKKNAL